MRSSGAAGAGPGAAPARRAPHFRQNFAASSLAVPQLEQNITAASRDTGVVSRAHGATTRCSPVARFPSAPADYTGPLTPPMARTDVPGALLDAHGDFVRGG